MKARKCDKCGRVYTPKQGESSFKLKFCDVFWVTYDEKYNKNFDLCCDCGYEMKEILVKFMTDFDD